MSAPRESKQVKRVGTAEGASADHVAAPLYVWLVVLLLLAGSSAIVITLLLLKRISLSLLAAMPAESALTRLVG